MFKIMQVGIIAAVVAVSAVRATTQAPSKDIANGLGAPAGGRLEPSQSAGTMRRSRPLTPPSTATLKDWNVAGEPESIWARSKT